MPSASPILLSISSVERETGLSKDTLRVWERRYGFPQPLRDDAGERAYPQDQVEKLRLIQKLMNRGYRPGKIVMAGDAELRALVGASAVPDGANHDLLHLLSLCRAHRAEDLRRELGQSLLRRGMHDFVLEVVAPLTALVGAEWSNGRLAVFEEHLYTESVTMVMRQAIGAMPPYVVRPGDAPRPRILLTTLPNEAHALGLLMAEALLALEGAQCLSLGVQTPVSEITRAVLAHRADVVALSFSSASQSAQVLGALADLRAALPPHVRIWTGGRCTVLARRSPPGILHLDLHDIPRALAEWQGSGSDT